MVSWTAFLVALVLVLGGLFAVLVLFGLSRSASGGDLDWQIARLERKVDLILTNMGIGHDDHVPEKVTRLASNGQVEEAVEEYVRLTGSRKSVARREVQYLREKLRASKGGPDPEP
ncbi:hypothetical protein OJF2_23900 [Aquisphaera giovannonii]|uniref:Uncharacterized protein n=1 Tax=Aquisphaera giovannonii TaxID=406548 RepID=A0A5B9W0R6_9BACT|nr:hypothetical protein [Aquisphaera giovannonii]QEH33859.1 hypothetical protein OJF2_23900 [Aquisphaera giovannonii]